jgi:hypothetical protein
MHEGWTWRQRAWYGVAPPDLSCPLAAMDALRQVTVVHREEDRDRPS